VLALLTAIGLVSHRSTAELQATLQWEVHTHEVLDQLHGVMRQMQAADIGQRSAHADASARRAQAVITSGSLLAFGCVAFAVYAIRRDLRRRLLAERALQQTLDSLERRVAERTERLSEANAELQREVAERKGAQARLVRSNDDLQLILDRLRCGTAMTDRDGRVAFLSRVAHELCGRPPGGAVGLPWEQLPVFAAADRERLRATAALPAERRSKMPIRVETAGGRRYWTEVDIQDDPRDPQRKIVFIYDVSELSDLRALLDEKGRFHGLIGKSAAMQRIFRLIQQLAAVDSTVLIEGETGTGKELIARAIHCAGARRDAPFVAVNCAGMTESLLGSQLFGHRKGAFTGAIADHRGVFEAADGGTLLLDEIGDVPLPVQTSLLRVLQEREVTRLGESLPRKVNVRVLAATHHDLSRDVAAKTFRSDLYYRIRVARIAVPPLRERREDIAPLAARFLAELRATSGRPLHEISAEAMRVLLAHAWPGNVRELRGAIECAVIGCLGEVLQADDLPSDLLPPGAGASPSAQVAALRELDEPQRYRAALELAAGNRAAAARLLGVSRATFYRHLPRIEPESDETTR